MSAEPWWTPPAWVEDLDGWWRAVREVVSFTGEAFGDDLYHHLRRLDPEVRASDERIVRLIGELADEQRRWGAAWFDGCESRAPRVPPPPPDETYR